MASTTAPAAPEILSASEGRTVKDSGWSVGVFDMIKDLTGGGSDDADVLCAMSMFCACVMEGKISAVVGQSFTYPPAKANDKTGLQWENCLVHYFLGGCCQTGAAVSGMLPIAWFFSCASIPASLMRKAIRHRYNIPGNKVTDIGVHFFCFPCALSQEYNELRLRIPKNPNHEWGVLGFLTEEEVTPF